MSADPDRRVLITTDTLGGVWHYAVELARALVARGVRVALASMGAPVTASQRAQLTGLPTLTLRESSFKLEWMQHAWDDVDRAGDWLLALEREFAPDLVHLNQFAFGTLPFAAPTLLVAHSCVLSWWRAVHGENAPPSWDEYRRRVSRGLAGAGRVAAPTRSMLESLADNYGYARDALVLANGRSAERFRPAPKQPFVFAAGRFWDAAKNLAALQAVAPLLPWPVRVAGATAHPDGGSALPTQLHCLGELPAEELARQMADAAIYALPARYEPFGLSVLEAGLSGCALVLGDIPSLRETWGPAASYVAPDDYPALGAALCRLIEQPAERDRLGAAARARALGFTTAQMADGYLAAYARLQPAFATPSREVQCA
jgi:glycogen synthase